MSFLKSIKNRLTSPKATVLMKFNKSSYALGENIGGTMTVSSSEDFDATEIRCEIQCVEEAKRMKRVYDDRLRVYVDREYMESTSLYSGRPALSGPTRIENGYRGSFPFSINIPAGGRPTYISVSGKVAWCVKGVVAVEGRPDITSTTTEIQVVQPTVAPTVVQAPSPTVVKEVIKEVVMIPCKYCGGLTPQTAMVCPNCGAKRTL